MTHRFTFLIGKLNCVCACFFPHVTRFNRLFAILYANFLTLYMLYYLINKLMKKKNKKKKDNQLKSTGSPIACNFLAAFTSFFNSS